MSWRIPNQPLNLSYPNLIHVISIKWLILRALLLVLFFTTMLTLIGLFIWRDWGWVGFCIWSLFGFFTRCSYINKAMLITSWPKSVLVRSLPFQQVPVLYIDGTTAEKHMIKIPFCQMVMLTKRYSLC